MSRTLDSRPVDRQVWRWSSISSSKLQIGWNGENILQIPGFPFATALMAVRMWLGGGEANTAPDTDALNIPSPTKPEINRYRHINFIRIPIKIDKELLVYIT